MSEPTLLETLLDLVDASLDSFDHPATLWFAELDAEGFSLGRKEVDGHPLPHLVGFVAPDEWDVLGVSVCGWMGDLDSSLPPSRQPGRRRIRQTVLVGRSGATAGIVRFADGGEPLTEPPGGGLVLDALRRCLGLPIDPASAQLLPRTADW